MGGVKHFTGVYYDNFQEHKYENSSHVVVEVLSNLRHSWRICAKVLRTFVQTQPAIQFRLIMNLMWPKYSLNVSYYDHLLSFTKSDTCRHDAEDAERLRSTMWAPLPPLIHTHGLKVYFTEDCDAGCLSLSESNVWSLRLDQFDSLLGNKSIYNFYRNHFLHTWN